MPITKSAEKALRVSKRKRVFNLRRSWGMKNALKEIKKLMAEKKGTEALKILPKAYKLIDKAAKKGVIKKNNAARKKSRLTISLNKVAK